MPVHYDWVLVALSIVIATLASYVALDLASRLTSSRGRANRVWWAGGSTAMGVGIWSMHFVGMLALRLPVPMGFDVPLVLTSVVVAVAASALALHVASRPVLPLTVLIASSVLMGGAITGMHYIGMAAMIVPVAIRWHPGLVFLSIVVAVVASFAALQLAFRLRDDVHARARKASAAGLMGLAIAGMHYTGMAAARFEPAGSAYASPGAAIRQDELSVAIVAGALLILGLALASAGLDLRVRSKTAAWRRLEALLENSSDAILLLDANGAIRFASESFRTLHGIRAPSVVGTEVFSHLHAADVPALRASFNECVSRPGAVVQAEVRMQGVDGGEVYREIIAVNRLHDPVLAGIVVNCRDVTEHRRHDEERELLLDRERCARHEAEAANRLKDEFLATLSHELRTPLNVILGRTKMLRAASREPAALENTIVTLERNGALLATLVNDLLDASRIALGRVQLNLQPVDVTGLLHLAMQGLQAATEAKGVRVTMQADPHLPAISGDPIRLQQVIWNLLTNAVKFTPPGGSVHVTLTRSNGGLRLQVRDTGEGIEASFLPHVFDMFRQGNAGPTRSHGGLGLGLSIVRELVELHGGTVRADSEGPGRGATFTVSLPYARQAAPVPAPVHASRTS